MRETVFRTDDVPVEDRFGQWHDLVRRGYAPIHMSSDHADSFYARQRVLELGDVHVWEAACLPSETVRAGRLIRQSDPEAFGILITRHGTLLAETAGRNVACGAGDLYCHDTSHSGEIAFRVPGGRGPYRGMSVILPRAALPLPTGKVDRIVGARVPGRDGMGGLLSAFLLRLMSDTGRLRPADGPRLGVVVRDLVSALFAGMLDAGAEPPAESRKRVLAMRAQDFILRNLPDPDLSPLQIAAAHHISLSYLHQVFRSQDTTVSRWIREQRLEHARRDLADPARRTVAVQHIAARWGFRNPADFTRAFRTAYGMPPGEYRRQPPRGRPAGRWS